MHPLLAQKLMIEVPEMKELLAFLIEKAEELDRIDDIADLSDPEEIALEVKARRRAYEKLKLMLSPLLNSDTKEVGKSINNDDYAMKV